MSASPDPATIVLVQLVELRAVAYDDWTEGSVEDRGLTLHRLRVLAELCTNRAAMIEETLVGSMETDRIRYHYGELVREPVTRESWKDEGANERLRDDLAKAVAAQIGLDLETGEVDQARRNIALAAVRAAYDAIPSFSSLKVVGRKRFLLDLRDYRSYDDGYKVKVIAREDA